MNYGVPGDFDASDVPGSPEKIPNFGIENAGIVHAETTGHARVALGVLKAYEAQLNTQQSIQQQPQPFVPRTTARSRRQSDRVNPYTRSRHSR